MKIEDNIVNERVIEARFSQDDLEAVLLNKICMEAGIPNSRNLRSSIIFNSRDCGSSGFKYEAKVKICVPLTD